METKTSWNQCLSKVKENLARNLEWYTRNELIVDDSIDLNNVQTAIGLIEEIDVITKSVS